MIWLRLLFLLLFLPSVICADVSPPSQPGGARCNGECEDDGGGGCNGDCPQDGCRTGYGGPREGCRYYSWRCYCERNGIEYTVWSNMCVLRSCCENGGGCIVDDPPAPAPTIFPEDPSYKSAMVASGEIWVLREHEVLRLRSGIWEKLFEGDDIFQLTQSERGVPLLLTYGLVREWTGSSWGNPNTVARETRKVAKTGDDRVLAMPGNSGPWKFFTGGDQVFMLLKEPLALVDGNDNRILLETPIPTRSDRVPVDAQIVSDNPRSGFVRNGTLYLESLRHWEMNDTRIPQPIVARYRISECGAVLEQVVDLRDRRLAGRFIGVDDAGNLLLFDPEAGPEEQLMHVAP